MTTIVENTKNAEQTAMTIRIALDGGPDAGKATAVRALGDALGGSVITPTEQDGRTLWFDWMAYCAEHVHGRPMRVELVTMPSPADPSNQRGQLLDWCDAVVFLVDTGRTAFADSVAAFTELGHDIGGHGEIPVTVIANKRDLLDVVALDDVRTQLRVGDGTTLIEGNGVNGGGIADAVVRTTRAVLANPINRLDSATIGELLADLQGALWSRTSMSPTDVAPDKVADPAPASNPEPVPVAAPAPGSEEPTTPLFTLRSVLAVDPPSPSARRLNPNAMRDGETMVISTEQWRVLVGIAERSPGLGLDDPTQAETIAELESWGLIVSDDSGVPDTGQTRADAVQF